ncbi:MgtC/SapB family protein [candidate division WOR-3 bacterium]|nr:MgtC/SapB family protein [candidate division WOR-3 bacterium]
MDPQYYSYILKLTVASLLGALIGIERDVHGRAAGLRTHILVCLGSALFMIISIETALNPVFKGTADPGRIAAQILTGIGFIGAGTILKEGFNVRGLTTAASLWVTAGIGMAVASGYFFIALYSTALAVITLMFIHLLEKNFTKDTYRFLIVEADDSFDPTVLIDLLKKHKIKIITFSMKKDYVEKTVRLKIYAKLFQSGPADKLSHEILKELETPENTIRSVRWDHQI